MIADLAKKHNVLVISDEVYEWLVYEPTKHVRIGRSIYYTFVYSIGFLTLNNFFYKYTKLSIKKSAYNIDIFMFYFILSNTS